MGRQLENGGNFGEARRMNSTIKGECEQPDVYRKIGRMDQGAIDVNSTSPSTDSSASSYYS
jgi:hypothetical protein